MSYGLNRVEPSRRVAVYVDRILKGAQPADLPCRATKFELAVCSAISFGHRMQGVYHGEVADIVNTAECCTQLTTSGP